MVAIFDVKIVLKYVSALTLSSNVNFFYFKFRLILKLMQKLSFKEENHGRFSSHNETIHVYYL